MHYFSKSRILTISLFILFPVFCTPEVSAQVNPLTKAIQLFDKRKFAEAEPVFKSLLEEHPDDFMINYFYGACRTENGHYTDQDLACLEKASKEVYPIDIDYYFGVQYHAKNNWSKAYAHYDSYRKVASPEEQKRVDLATKIDQCIKLVNPFAEPEQIVKSDSIQTDTTQPETVLKERDTDKTEDNDASPIVAETAIIVAAETNMSEKNTDNVQVVASTDSVPQEEVKQPEKAEPEQVQKPVEPTINFNINNEITYFFVSAFKTENGKSFYAEGTEKQAELDKIVLRTEILRDQYSHMKTKSEKDSIGKLILDLENDSYILKDSIRQQFLLAKNAENEYWQTVQPDEISNFMEKQNERLQQALKTEETKAHENETIVISPLLVEESIEKSPAKPAKPSPVIYKIQIGAYSKGIPNNMKPVFNKISMIRKVETYTDEKGVTVYTTGNLTRYEDAVQMQTQVKQEGVKGAIIASYSNGKRITLDQAKQLEKQK